MEITDSEYIIFREACICVAYGPPPTPSLLSVQHNSGALLSSLKNMDVLTHISTFISDKNGWYTLIWKNVKRNLLPLCREMTRRT